MGNPRPSVANGPHIQLDEEAASEFQLIHCLYAQVLNANIESYRASLESEPLLVLVEPLDSKSVQPPGREPESRRREGPTRSGP